MKIVEVEKFNYIYFFKVFKVKECKLKDCLISIYSKYNNKLIVDFFYVLSYLEL